MVTLSIAGGVTAVGAPSLSTMLVTQQVKSTTYDFYSALIYARSEAVQRRAVVTVQPRGDSFSNGWDIQVGDTMLRRDEGNKAVAITTPAEVMLAYGQDGRLMTTIRYQVALTSPRNAQVRMRCIDVDLTGRPAILVDANGDGNCNNG